MTSRRDFLRTTSLAGIAAAAAAGRLHAEPADLASIAPPPGPLDQVARDEAYWARIAAQYRVPREPINLEGGYFGLMATPVLEAYHRNIDRANGESSYFARREYPPLSAPRGNGWRRSSARAWRRSCSPAARLKRSRR